MRIGLVCPYNLSRPGGVQTQVMGLREALRTPSDEVMVIGPGLPEAVPGWDLGSTISVRANGSMAPISLDPRVRKTIRRVAKDIDVLHVHEPFMPLVGLAALRAGPPVVATFHAAAIGIGRHFYNLVGTQGSRLLGRNVRRVTAVSRTAANALPRGLDPLIIPNGIDVSAFAPIGADRASRVVFLGRDEPRKGLDILLEAWPRVVHEIPNAKLVVMGSDRGTEGVEWLGVVDDQTKAEVLGSAAVYVAPNLGAESFGIVLIEAMAAGAAVVASDLEAFVDVGGEAATYFESGDPSSLATAVTRLLEDEAKRSTLADAGAARATDFDWVNVASRYRDLYEQALSV